MLKHCFRILFFIGFLLSGNLLVAQNLDSLEANIHNIKNPNEKLKYYFYLSDSYYTSDRKKSTKLLEEALEIAKAN